MANYYGLIIICLPDGRIIGRITKANLVLAGNWSAGRCCQRIARHVWTSCDEVHAIMPIIASPICKKIWSNNMAKTYQPHGRLILATVKPGNVWIHADTPTSAWSRQWQWLEQISCLTHRDHLIDLRIIESLPVYSTATAKWFNFMLWQEVGREDWQYRLPSMAYTRVGSIISLPQRWAT